MLAVFGAATLAHMLVVSMARRRPEIGLLKVAGLRPPTGRRGRGVAGHDAGRHRDRGRGPPRAGRRPGGVECLRRQPGGVPVTVIPIVVIVVLAAGVLAGANVIAIAPALFATRSKPADLLRPLD